MLHKAPSQYFV